jgi:transaldolase / glucose-6-phosphate isomerase
VDARARLIEMHAVERLAARDATLFADPALARTRLGWVGMPRAAAASAAEFAQLASEATASGVTDVVLLGMGGSSLAAVVLSRSIAGAEGRPALHVLETTSPDQVCALMGSLSPASTLVIVSSKSGTTVEPLALLAVFRTWMAATLGDAVGDHFMAITDPGSPLETLAAGAGFSRIVEAPADVGGRFAALSPFATLPAAMAGVDVAYLAASAQALEDACASLGDDNPAAALAEWLSDAYAAGRDKLTVVCSPTLASFGLWVEQLVAESTGKTGRGVLPVLEGSPGLPESHGPDRMTFVLRGADDEALDGLAGRLPDGEPVFEVVVDDPYLLAAEFVHWEWAVALFAALEGIEPFGQPDVEASKAATSGILRDEAAAPRRVALADGTQLSASPGIASAGIDAAVSGLLGRIGAGGYLAVLAYLPEDEGLLAPLRAACAEVSVARRIPVTLELGPRYLHSTGQYHKGGPATGAFLVIAVEDEGDLPVPGEPFTLAALHAAQPDGDAAALLDAGRPVLAIRLPALAGLRAVTGALRSAARA